MNFYFAPLEGITGYIYRNAYEKYYPGIQKYFTPFITTNQNFVLKPQDRRDILPENNKGLCLVPQILTNRADQFLDMQKKLSEYGYREINLNLGCPSKTVVTKKKGSGFLAYPEELDRFLDEIFEHSVTEISIKTRIGRDSREEFSGLLEMYNKYPLKELIVHPRLQADYYKNEPDMELFAQAEKLCKCPLCYNGDLFTREQICAFEREHPKTGTVMLGRGLLRNPALHEQLQGDFGAERLRAFTEELWASYTEAFSGDRNVLYKMKEVWFYLFQNMPGSENYVKQMKKAQTLEDYRNVVSCVFMRK